MVVVSVKVGTFVFEVAFSFKRVAEKVVSNGAIQPYRMNAEQETMLQNIMNSTPKRTRKDT